MARKTIEKKTSLTFKAYSLIKDRIITLEYKPGAKLEENQLTKDTGIGRTPVREAVRMLISDGLIVSYGSNSIHVKDLTLKNSKELMSVLYHMGDLIFSLANPEADFTLELTELNDFYQKMNEVIEKEQYLDFVRYNNNFHRVLGKIARNEYVDALVEKLYSEEMRLSFILSLQTLNIIPPKEHYRRVQNQHKEFIELLGAKDLNALKKVYHTHFEEGQARLLNYFRP